MTASLDAVSHDRVVAGLAERAAQAHAALMRGDLRTYLSHITTTPDFLLMAPFGGEPTRGAELSSERWESVGRFFAHGCDASFELLQAYIGADMVVLTAIERAHVEVGGLPAQDWSLRVTLVFRKQAGRWLLAHRHADPLAEGIGLEQAAALARPRPSGRA